VELAVRFGRWGSEVDMSEIETFPAFPKIPRLRRRIVVTEKIDGTNALVSVSECFSRATTRRRGTDETL
jgi:hypothetical protein